MIQIDHVSFGYTGGQETLHDFDLHIAKGECVLLCGESGCGKTSVTKLINGLVPHFQEGCTLQGDVTAAGLPVAKTELYELAKHIGSVFQNPKSQFFNLDTDSEIAFGLENEGMSPEQMEERMKETVEALQIQNLLHRNIFALSGGEKQTLAFASVYAMSPAIYVLDEPTANLDEQAIQRLRQQILLLKEQGHTVVIAEHRLYFLADVIDRAVYIRDGKITRTYTGAEFRTLSDDTRKDLGLRSISETALDLPEVCLAEKNAGLTIAGLRCAYKKGTTVFENLSFSAEPGEVIAITGHNGAGKTTLVRCLCGLMKETTGTITLDGEALKPKQRQRASFLVMQDVNHQLFYDSVWSECEQAAGEDAESSEIEAALEQFDLLPFRERHPMALSGGQKQRLAIATAVLSKKKVLIFDEPTSGLDYHHMCEVSAVVRTLAKQGHIVLVVSHDKEFMAQACDRILTVQ